MQSATTALVSARTETTVTAIVFVTEVVVGGGVALHRVFTIVAALATASAVKVRWCERISDRVGAEPAAERSGSSDNNLVEFIHL